MRIDKYLKVARIIKRRTIAKDVLDFGFVKINDKVAKPSSEVKEGDILSLKLGERLLKVKVCATANTIKKEDSKALFEIVSDEVISL